MMTEKVLNFYENFMFLTVEWIKWNLWFALKLTLCGSHVSAVTGFPVI